MYCHFIFHSTSLLLTSFTFIFLLFELLSSPLFLIPLIILNLTLFTLTILSAYSLITKTLSPTHKPSCGIQEIFQTQNRQQQKQTLMKQLNLPLFSNKSQIESNLISLYRLSGYCTHCSTVQSSRSHHCLICNKCVPRYECHNKILGLCIGQHNIKPYFQFLVSIFLFCLFIMVSLLFVWVEMEMEMRFVGENRLIGVMLGLKGMCCVVVMLVGVEIGVYYRNMRENRTKEESGREWMRNKVVFEGNYFREIFKRWVDLVRIQLFPEMTHVDFVEEGSIY